MQWTGLWSNTVGSVHSLGRYLGARTEVHATALRAGEDLSGNGTLRQWLGMVWALGSFPCSRQAHSSWTEPCASLLSTDRQLARLLIVAVVRVGLQVGAFLVDVRKDAVMHTGR